MNIRSQTSVERVISPGKDDVILWIRDRNGMLKMRGQARGKKS
jgi:hypothetical protein